MQAVCACLPLPGALTAAARAPGDCLQAGPDPPEPVLVLLDTELAEAGALGAPLLKPPQSFELVWADEAARPERQLSFWRPVPFEGCGGRALQHLRASVLAYLQKRRRFTLLSA